MNEGICDFGFAICDWGFELDVAVSFTNWISAPAFAE